MNDSATHAGCLPDYAELHCLSNYSFLRGASHPEELVSGAFARRYAALALTDECSVAGVVRAYQRAKTLLAERPHAEPNQRDAHGVCAADAAPFKFIIGSEIRFTDGPKLVLLAQTRDGYGNLCALITRGRRNAAKGCYRLTLDDIEDGLPDCLALLIPDDVEADARHAAWLAQRFPRRAWIAAELHCGADDRRRLGRLQALAQRCGLSLVAAGDVHMHTRARQPLQDIATAIRLGKPVRACGHALFPNAERHLRPRVHLARIYPAPLLRETLRIAAACSFTLDELRYEYPDEIVPAGLTPAAYLRQEVRQGLVRRYGDAVPESVRRQIEHELELIAAKRYEPYFLTVYDIVNFARARHILCQGRGSAANSAVCYALGITEVDPARSNMLFERFISKERDEPPDIDVDFEHDRREEVIQYVYGKYGRERAALAAEVIRYRPRSAIRDVGKALGLEPAQIDGLAHAMAWRDGSDALTQRLREAGAGIDTGRLEQLCRYARMLCGFPRHLSQHVGGFVIARTSLSRMVPVENAAMRDRSVIQWEKDDLEALGLMKVDVLALGMLSAIRRTLAYIGAWHNRPLTMQDIPGEDARVFEMIQAADTVGVFQIESRAQMNMLSRLKPACYYDLVVEIAIVRPGPIQGGMVHPYLARREKLARGEALAVDDYPSPEVEAVLKRTLGVPIFQEQVMELAVVAAGFTRGEADQLRRAMATWQHHGGMQDYRDRLVDGMRSRGYKEEFAQRLFEQIAGFGEYGFPESHSASFALLAYVSAWLKHHHPAAFLAGLLNSQPMGFYAPAQLVQDARRHHVEVHPVDVCESAYDCTLERSTHGEAMVRLGMRMIKGLSHAGAERIVAARATGPFTDVADLALRAGLSQRDLQCLTHAGALRSLSAHRRHAHWLVAGLDTVRQSLPRWRFTEEGDAQLAPPCETAEIAADYASLGLTLGRHPLALLRPRLQRAGSRSALEINAQPRASRARMTGLVISRQRPATASGTVFLTLEDETGSLNAVIRPHLAAQHRQTLLAARLLTIQGSVERAGSTAQLIARTLIDQSSLLGTLVHRSRDFR